MAIVGSLLLGCGENSGGEGSDLGKPRHDPQCGRNTDNYERCGIEIDLYCQYGSVSVAQRNSCEKRITWGEIKRLDTNAARYSRFELQHCLADAGPFCRSLEPDNGDYYAY
jgi:hypothetical protein